MFNGYWESSPSNHLVFIGADLESQALSLTLQDTTSLSSSTTPPSLSVLLHSDVLPAATLPASFSGDGRFTDFECDGSTVSLRLGGAQLYGLTPEIAKDVHGIDLESLQVELVREFNSLAHDEYLLPLLLDGLVFVTAVYSAETWPVFQTKIIASADKVLERNYGMVCGCKRNW